MMILKPNKHCTLLWLSLCVAAMVLEKRYFVLLWTESPLYSYKDDHFQLPHLLRIMNCDVSGASYLTSHSLLHESTFSCSRSLMSPVKHISLSLFVSSGKADSFPGRGECKAHGRFVSAEGALQHADAQRHLAHEPHQAADHRERRVSQHL